MLYFFYSLGMIKWNIMEKGNITKLMFEVRSNRVTDEGFLCFFKRYFTFQSAKAG